MTDPASQPEPPVQRQVQEYEDPHYHDDEETPSDDGHPRPRPPARRKTLRPPRRRFEED